MASVNCRETRSGNVDFLVAERLLEAYGATFVDLGLMTQLAEKHLKAAGRDSLYEAMVAAILAEFEQLRREASPLLVPMPDPAGLLREIDRRIAPIERHFREAFRGLEALRSTLPTLARHLAAEWDKGAVERVKVSRLPRWFSGSGEDEETDR